MRDGIYALFCQRLRGEWLVGIDGEAVISGADRMFAEFNRLSPNFISIATADPIEFIIKFMVGVRSGIPIFLCNPGWGAREWEQVSKLTEQVNPQQHQNTIMIPTGGSSGEIKFAMHTWATLSASVWGFQEFYQVDKINAVCTLPLYHVSGLMQLMRSILTDGKLVIIDFHQIDPHLTAMMNEIDLGHYFISLVPTQLSKLLDLDCDWLVQFYVILLGGAPPSNELLNKARIAKLPLALTYGMTETASQITSLKPKEFLTGNNSCGKVLPHASIELRSSSNIDKKSISISAKSLMLGYFPTLDSSIKRQILDLKYKKNTVNYFEPDDLGEFDSDGYLTILGRNSGKIITGGENVFPIEIIDAIMTTGLVADVWVVGLPDPYWGQMVTAIYVENHHPVSAAILSRAIAGKISKFKIPKRWISVDLIPRNTLGKVLMRELELLLKSMNI
jgi:o-succinylbenzoate---CoA ligase